MSPTARSDVRHVAVEFVHPVIVGKRALPALGLVGDSAPLATEVRLAASADDIVMAFGDDPELSVAITAARAAGALTLAFAPLHAEWELVAPAGDPFIAQELVETAYHVLWELVHVFFEHRGLLQGRTERRAYDAGAASFLYPFLADQEDDLEAVLDDVARSAMMKAREVCELREATLRSGGDRALAAAAAGLRGAFDGGGRLMALGNGGSATDAMDVVADFAMPPAGRRLAGAAGARSDRRSRDPDRDRQRHRRRGDLRAPDHRPRSRRRRVCWCCRPAAARLRRSTRWRRLVARACSRSRWSATTGARSARARSPTT